MTALLTSHVRAKRSSNFFSSRREVTISFLIQNMVFAYRHFSILRELLLLGFFSFITFCQKCTGRGVAFRKEHVLLAFPLFCSFLFSASSLLSFRAFAVFLFLVLVEFGIVGEAFAR